MKELKVRKGTIKDLDDIVALEQVCFTTPWSRESLLNDVVENPMSTYLVAEIDSKVVGYVGIWVIIDEGHINNVAVSPEYRRQHIGSILIDTMLKVTERAGIKSHTLEVRAGNEAAIGLYKGFGFEEAGLRKGYYADDGEDGLIMWRNNPNLNRTK